MVETQTKNVNVNYVPSLLNLSKRTQLLRRLLFATAIAGVVLFAAAVGQARANGDAIEVFSGESGSYAMKLGILPATPLVGIVHFTVELTDIATGDPVRRAVVTIVAEDEAGEPTYQSFAVNNPAEPQYYEANITFQLSGTWGMVISIEDKNLGAAEFNVPVEIGERTIGFDDLGTFVWAGLVIVLFGGGFMIYRATTRKARSESK